VPKRIPFPAKIRKVPTRQGLRTGEKAAAGVPEGRTWRFVTSLSLTFCHSLTRNRTIGDK